LSSGAELNVLVCGVPGDVLVVGGVVAEAAVEDPDEPGVQLVDDRNEGRRGGRVGGLDPGAGNCRECSASMISPERAAT
jgi:hypothetical protein